jgi:adenosine kinase
VDSLDVRRGGCAANIAYGLGVLGLNPILIAAVGKDWADYEAWLTRHGVRYLSRIGFYYLAHRTLRHGC